MIRYFLAALVALSVNAEEKLLTRHYRDGEKLTYLMKAVNDGRTYEIRATGIVKKDADGKFFEEYAWNSPHSKEFRQILSLEPDKTPAIPNLAAVHRSLIGPITDFMTFYVDLWLATKVGNLSKPGDRFYQKIDHPASWADGTYVILGQDSIDFDITLLKVDRTSNVATLLVKHIPPKEPLIKIPAAWMKKPVADTPNNWVQVKKKDGRFEAAIGKETFDVTIDVSLIDGKILSALLENPVEMQERHCQDEALTDCDEPKLRKIFRKIELTLER